MCKQHASNLHFIYKTLSLYLCLGWNCTCGTTHKRDGTGTAQQHQCSVGHAVSPTINYLDIHPASTKEFFGMKLHNTMPWGGSKPQDGAHPASTKGFFGMKLHNITNARAGSTAMMGPTQHQPRVSLGWNCTTSLVPGLAAQPWWGPPSINQGFLWDETAQHHQCQGWQHSHDGAHPASTKGFFGMNLHSSINCQCRQHQQHQPCVCRQQTLPKEWTHHPPARRDLY